MNKRQVYQDGIERGYDVASWQELPELGQSIDKSIDWIGLGDTIKDKQTAQEYFVMVCNDVESNDRQYSHFEFTAHEINECGNADDLWNEYDRGIARGIYLNWRKRSKGFYPETKRNKHAA